MAGSGRFMMFVAAWAAWLQWRRHSLVESPLFLKAVVVALPFGFIGVESGWFVTELGRQPWIIYKVMETRSAVTTVPNILGTFIGFTLLYAGLGVALVILLRRLGDNRRAQPAKPGAALAT